MTTEHSSTPDNGDNTADKVSAETSATPETTTTEATETTQQGNEQSLAELQQALAEANAKVEENWTLYLQAKAETDNIRKRAERDVESAHKYALDKFVPALLAVKDSLEMGLKAAEDSKEIEKFIEGNNLTLKLFNDTLTKFNVVEVYPKGEAFNPDLHQAMTMLASEEHPANVVIDVIQKGYTLNDRLVRPALVVVSQGKQ